MKSTDLRPGMAILLDGNMYVITQYTHVTPGNLRAFVQVKIKNLENGTIIEKRLRSGEEVDLEPRRGFTDKEHLIHASRHDGGRLHRAGGRLLEVPLVTRDGAIGEPAPHAQRRRSRERRQSEPRCEVGLRSPALSFARLPWAAAAASH